MIGEVNVTAELITAAQDYLDLTWADEAETRKLNGMLARGMARLDEISGVALDYAEGTSARELLLDRVRYAQAGCLQDFEKDYAPELLGLHIAGRVKQEEVPADGKE